MGTKLVQGECRTKQKPWFLFFMPSRSLTWAKPKCARRVQDKTSDKAFASVFTAFEPPGWQLLP